MTTREDTFEFIRVNPDHLTPGSRESNSYYTGLENGREEVIERVRDRLSKHSTLSSDANTPETVALLLELFIWLNELDKELRGKESSS